MPVLTRVAALPRSGTKIRRIAAARTVRRPINTNRPVPRDRVRAVCRALRQVSIAAPVTTGDVIVAHILDSGADIIAA